MNKWISCHARVALQSLFFTEYLNIYAIHGANHKTILLQRFFSISVKQNILLAIAGRTLRADLTRIPECANSSWLSIHLI